MTSPLVLKLEWAALFMLVEGLCVTCSLTFTSGARPGDLLAANKATYLQYDKHFIAFKCNKIMEIATIDYDM